MRMSSGQKAASAPILHLDNQTQQEYWTMFRDKISGIAVAATLGTATLLGATHANAVVDLDAKDKSKPVVLFSKELVGATSITGVGDNAGKTWHPVNGATGALDIKVKLGHSVLQNDSIEVKFELTNMVFGTVNTATDPILVGDNGGTAFTIAPTVPAALTGKSVASFLFTAPTNLPETATVTWDIGEAAGGVFGIAPSGNGAITATVTNLTVARAGGTAGHMASYPNAVQLGSSLSVGSMPSNLTADVADGFKSFTLGRFGTPTKTVMGNVGKVFAKLATPAPTHPDGTTPVTISTILTVTDGTSKVTLTGNFGAFLEDADATTAGLQGAVALDEEATCDSTGAATVAVTIDATGKAAAVDLADLTGTPTNVLDHYVCLTVDGETAIPATEAYGAMIELDGAAGITATLPSGTHPLGMIERNGTTIHIPFVTTHQQYHQRFMIVNNGPATTYEFTFMPEEGTTAEPGMMAMDELAAGETIVLDAMDVVMLTGKSRTAATVTISSSPGDIEMSTILRSKEGGAMEITVLQPE